MEILGMTRFPSRRLAWTVSAAALALTAAVLAAAAASSAAAAEKMLVHDVYFSLTDKSPDAQEKLIVACKRYLSEHPGTVWFAVGTLAPDLNRDVNDRDFDVALQLVFASKEAHDRYQKSDRHEKFIAECKENWAKVRVFDSYVAGSAHGPTGERPKTDKPHADRLYLPDLAAHFAGMVQGKVVAKRDHGIVVKVEKVVKQWEQSKAKNAETLVGKAVFVNLRSEHGKLSANLVKFVEKLDVGQSVTLDVAHQEGEALTLLELTAEQRKAIGL
jgi:hypothetical protein